MHAHFIPARKEGENQEPFVRQSYQCLKQCLFCSSLLFAPRVIGTFLKLKVLMS